MQGPPQKCFIFKINFVLNCNVIDRLTSSDDKQHHWTCQNMLSFIFIQRVSRNFLSARFCDVMIVSCEPVKKFFPFEYLKYFNEKSCSS